MEKVILLKIVYTDKKINLNIYRQEIGVGKARIRKGKQRCSRVYLIFKHEKPINRLKQGENGFALIYRQHYRFFRERKYLRYKYIKNH